MNFIWLTYKTINVRASINFLREVVELPTSKTTHAPCQV